MTDHLIIPNPMNNYRIDSPHRQFVSPHDRETMRLKAELELRIRQAITPFLPKDQEGQRIANLCVQQLSDSWSDEVGHGLDGAVAQYMILAALDDEIIPKLRGRRGTGITHELIGAMNTIADQLVVARESMELDGAWNTPDRAAKKQIDRDNNTGAQLGSHRAQIRHEVNNSLARRGSKGGRPSRPPVRKF